MNRAVYDRLVAVAKSRGLITYAELGRVADLDISYLPDLDTLVRILEEIALNEIEAGRPLLVVLVIREDINMPAKGLFRFAKRHGLQKGNDDVAFFTKELARVYQAWTGD